MCWYWLLDHCAVIFEYWLTNLTNVHGGVEFNVDATKGVDQIAESRHVDSDVKLHRHPHDGLDGVPERFDTGVRARADSRIQLGVVETVGVDIGEEAVVAAIETVRVILEHG